MRSKAPIHNANKLSPSNHRSKLRNNYYVQVMSSTGSSDFGRSDTNLEVPYFPIEYEIFCSTLYSKSYINRFRLSGLLDQR